MATVAELQEALDALKADLEAKTTAIGAEFTKLEEEVAKGGGIEPAALDPLKAQITALDEGVKGITVPSA